MVSGDFQIVFSSLGTSGHGQWYIVSMQVFDQFGSPCSVIETNFYNRHKTTQFQYSIGVKISFIGL